MMSILLPLVSLVLAFIILFVWPHWRQRRLLSRPFPDSWETILERRLPAFQRLQESDRERLRQGVQLFVADKRFHGCAGLAVTDEIRVSIAAQACLLVLNRPGSLYPGVRHILVYPAAFRIRGPAHREDGTVSVGAQSLLGQAWQAGKVILSWDDVEFGLSDPDDGSNVAIHEFAHQLDQQNGAMDGIPLVPPEQEAEWHQVIKGTLRHLRHGAGGWRADVLDDYAAENEAELFAVSSEVFFEQPAALADGHPALFRLLSAYYGVDPRAWHHG